MNITTICTLSRFWATTNVHEIQQSPHHERRNKQVRILNSWVKLTFMTYYSLLPVQSATRQRHDNAHKKSSQSFGIFKQIMLVIMKHFGELLLNPGSFDRRQKRVNILLLMACVFWWPGYIKLIYPDKYFNYIRQMACTKDIMFTNWIKYLNNFVCRLHLNNIWLADRYIITFSLVNTFLIYPI